MACNTNISSKEYVYGVVVCLWHKIGFNMILLDLRWIWVTNIRFANSEAPHFQAICPKGTKSTCLIILHLVGA